MVLAAILVVAALILVNAVYVAAEFAAVSTRRSRIRQLAEEGNRLACWLMPILERPVLLERYIGACQIGITVSGLVLGAYAQATIAGALTPWVAWAGLQESTASSASIAIVLLLLTVAQVIFAELVPRSLALRYPTAAALYAVIPMAPSMWLFRPFITWLNATGLVLRRLIGAPPRAHRHIHSPEEIELLIAESRDGGLLEPDEHRRLRRALRLNARQAKQLMVPRPEISAIDYNTPLSTVIRFVLQSPYSRLPVYRESIDNIVGMLHTKDLVRWLVSGTAHDTLESIIRPIASVPESVTADRVLRSLRERRTHQALVVDEFGGTSGLITREDILEEIVGEIRDEHDAEATPSIRRDGTRFWVDGRVSLDELSEALGTTFAHPEVSTVGGLVYSALGRVPRTGEELTLDGYKVVVERVDRRRVTQVSFEKPASE